MNKPLSKKFSVTSEKLSVLFRNGEYNMSVSLIDTHYFSLGGKFALKLYATSCAESGMAVSIYQYPVATFRTFKLIISKIWCTAYDSL